MVKDQLFQDSLAPEKLLGLPSTRMSTKEAPIGGAAGGVGPLGTAADALSSATTRASDACDLASEACRAAIVCCRAASI